MAKFDIAYERTAKFEGGYTNDPDDNGNWTGGKKGVGELIGTNFGITAQEYTHFLGHVPTVEEMKSMPVEHRRAIYQKNYWSIIRGYEINNQDSANEIYDASVNMGVKTAIKLAQRDLGILETGLMDDHTLNLINNKS